MSWAFGKLIATRNEETSIFMWFWCLACKKEENKKGD